MELVTELALELAMEHGPSRGSRDMAELRLTSPSQPAYSRVRRILSSGMTGRHIMARHRAVSSDIIGSIVLATLLTGTGYISRNSGIPSTLIWAPAGIALAALLQFGVGLWPGVVLAAILEPLFAGLPLSSAVGDALGTIIAVVGSAAVLRQLAFQKTLQRTRDALSLVVVGAGGVLLGGAVDCAYLSMAGGMTFSTAATASLLVSRAQFLAILVLTPVLLGLANDPRGTWLQGRYKEAVALLVLLLVNTWVAIGKVWNLPADLPSRYLVFPLFPWAALRFGPTGAQLSSLIILLLTAGAGSQTVPSVTLLWSWMAVVSIMGLLLGANTVERGAWRKQSEIIAEASLALISSLNLDQVLEALLLQLERLVPYDTATVMLVDGDEMEIRAGRGYDRWPSLPGPGTRFPLANHPLWNKLQNRRPLIVSDVRDVAEWVVAPGTEFIRSWLGVPLVVSGKVIGQYSLEKAEPEFFTEEHARLVEKLAAHAAVAITNARLYADRARLEEKFQSMLQSSPVPMCINTLEEGRYLEVNDRFVTVLGYSREELVGRTGKEIGVWLHPEQRQQMVERLVRHGRVESFEAEIRTKSGETRVLLISGETIGENSPYVLTAGLDITESRRLEEQFRQVQKMDAIGRLAGGVAHDFNNMLAVIIGRAEQLVLKWPPGDPAHGPLEEIRQTGWRAAALTRQLLAFSRQKTVRLRPVRLNSVVQEMQRMLGRLIGETIQMTVKLDTDLGSINADPGGLEQVLMNLCVNARDAMTKGGTLAISTSNASVDAAFPLRHGTLAPGRYVRLTVSDTGVGMSDEVQARLFEPFFTTKEFGKGTGLGLSTVYRIVEECGGVISVYSEPGSGATFKIYFPRVEETAAAPTSFLLADIMPRGAETVLVVEDEDPVRIIVQDCLETAGYTVIAARNGKEAIERSQRHGQPVHLLVTDVVLPGMSGMQLARQLREAHPRLKVLCLSGYTSDVLLDHGAPVEGSHFLEKPFRMMDLSVKVRQALDERAASAAVTS
jgi:PAS domain S-box-containing protein